MATFKKRPERLKKHESFANAELTQKSQNSIETPMDLLNFAKNNGISGIPVNVRDIAKLFDIALRFYPMDNEHSGYIRYEEGRWVIGVNSLHHPKRQRFTIAHELGHFFLHRETVKIEGGIEDKIFFRANGKGETQIEREANSFAAELLMPRSEFIRLAKETNGEIDRLSDQLQVSAMAISYRSQSLSSKF